MFKSKLLLVLTIFTFCLVSFNADVSFAEGDGFVGKAVPAFVATDIDGNEIDIKSFKGKPVLVNFWGLRCGACIEEMPHLNALYDKYSEKGLTILGINADGIGADFLKGPRGMAVLPHEMKYTIIQDADMKLIDVFKMEAAPLNILVDKEGIVRFYHMGFEPGDEKVLEEKVAEVIK
jgi:thiol-disulfide isomerase/thioredoxin